MEQLLIDGVPVLWQSAEGPFTAGLVFGVGRRDETFLDGGLTHLIEHLAMSAVGRTTLDCNASVDLTCTRFTASGRPERVAEFLRRVCEAICDLPVERLAIEAEVLRAEGGVLASPAVGALLSERYGARGLGLAGYTEPALLSLTPDDVRHWATTRFVRGAAALWLTGPPPDGLRLPLPEGPAPERAPEPVRAMTLPALTQHPGDGGVSIGAEVVRSPGLAAACRILRDRVEDDLRHRRGLSYTVDTDVLPVDADRRFVSVSADCRDGQEAVAARALWSQLSRLAEHGPDDGEVEHERDLLAEHLADPRAVAEELDSAAVGLVLHLPHLSGEQLWANAVALTGEQVRDAAAAVRDAAMVAVPAEVDVPMPGLTAVPDWSLEVLPGQAFGRRPVGSGAPRGARLLVGDHGVSVALGPGRQLSVRWAEAIALLQLAPREWSLVGVDGISVPLAPQDWRDGERAVDMVRAAVPEQLQRPADSMRPAGRRVLLMHAPPHAATEALWPSRRDAWIAQNERWTLVARPAKDDQGEGDAAWLSGALGRKHAVLLLELAHDELTAAVWQRGKERARHVWTGTPAEAGPIADLLGADPGQLAEVLAHPGRPQEVLVALHRTLEVPEQAAPVLAGTPLDEVTGLVHERARGVRESFTAAVRGEFDPPDSTALHHRISRWEQQRPAAYRAVNAVAALAQAAGALAFAARTDGDWTSWPGALAALLTLGAVGSLWSSGPPRTTA